MLDLSLRHAQLDDAAAYHQFMTMIFSENLPTLIPPDTTPDLRAASRYISRHDGNRSALIFAETNEKIVGIANFTRFERAEKDHTIGVGLYVCNGYRDQGVGRQLMETGIKWSHAVHDVERIELLVMANNGPALRLYESLGFVREGIKRCAIKKPFGYVDVIVMGLLMNQAAQKLADSKTS